MAQALLRIHSRLSALFCVYFTLVADRNSASNPKQDSRRVKQNHILCITLFTHTTHSTSTRLSEMNTLFDVFTFVEKLQPRKVKN